MIHFKESATLFYIMTIHSDHDSQAKKRTKNKSTIKGNMSPFIFHSFVRKRLTFSLKHNPNNGNYTCSCVKAC